MNELVKNLDILYDYGEIDNSEILNYLIDLNFLKFIEDKLVITKKWVKFSGKVSREEFVSSLLCYYSVLLKTLLLRVYKEACNIAESGDGKALFEFINSTPKFADEILKIQNEPIDENEDIKSLYQVIFNGYPQYPSILSKLKVMQLAENINDLDILPMGANPNENWISGRRITSSISLKIRDKNRFILTPYEYLDFEVEKESKEVLSYPWKTFLIILSMVVSEYKVAGFEGIAIRPTDFSNPYNEQELDLYIFNAKGNEIKVGSLDNFIYEFCSKNDLYLFPDKVPMAHKVVFQLLGEHKIDFKDGEYVLNQDFNDFIYSKDMIIKNRSRKFKNNLKDYIEDLRNVL
ncbi:hypothetical protein [Clostridium sporogenes]|uniref:hypothetical protein n=1 Tax=Clostridium sporogenes TaxID=1509 RepID=UPI002238BB1F|nr:hypothetical protein [Clostridium sporogenes]MCW6078093.1 hypothetical protein [Clostridium sporogenes]